MLEWLKETLWKNRNEPLLVILGGGLLAVVLVVLVYQVLIRQAPLTCPGIVLPSSQECPEEEVVALAEAPVGTIVAYLGSDDEIPDGWLACNGQPVPQDSPLSAGFSALPDLRGKFVRGSIGLVPQSPLVQGGSDMISVKHGHRWARAEEDNQGGRWYSFDSTSVEFRVDNWTEGLGNQGSGLFPLYSTRDTVSLYTKHAGSEEVDILPSYVELRYIIRVY